MFLLCRCGGLLCGIAALHGLDVGRYGLGGVVLDEGCGGRVEVVGIRICRIMGDFQD